MKVLLVHNRPRSNGPSGENRVVDQESAALAEAGHEVIRFGRDSDEINSWSPARKAMLPVQLVWNSGTRKDLTVALREHRPDVVHVHNTFPLLSGTVLYACADVGVPIVATLHNYRLGCTSGTYFRDGAICHDCAGGALLPGVRHGCYRGSRAASAPLALSIAVHRPAWHSLVSAYIFISASQRDLLGEIGLPADRLFVRHNMIPRRELRPVRREPFVLYSGRLADEKGLRLLMAAWDRYRDSTVGPGLRLVIAGTGPLDREMADWAATRPSVELAGFVPGGRNAELMAGARAVLVPSIWEEPFGLVVVEAMAAGTAPVATERGSFRELVTPGVDGELFPPDDPAALAAIIADIEARPAKYDALGYRARETYEQRFNPEHSLKHLIEIYNFAIANPADDRRRRQGKPKSLQRAQHMQSTLRRRLATSPLGRAAALPLRTARVARYDARLIGRSVNWLVRNRETTNFTYDLDELNRDQLSWFVSAVTGAEIGDVRSWMTELETDQEFHARLTERLAANPTWRINATEPHLARRYGWYAIVRALQPDNVVETGTHLGLGSCVIAAALLRNGHGRLTTIDIDDDSGYLIEEPWSSVIDRRVGSSVDVLAKLREVDMFLHDSLHTYEYENAELTAVEPNLKADAIVLSDNAHDSAALSHWAERAGRHYLFFKEQPVDHWWPGDGIGVAWAK
jgi:glycosyltransferase involved in cell wall biosynthesis/predicted O-methyltransferase YrrM